jgi:hypothetical protein
MGSYLFKKATFEDEGCFDRFLSPKPQSRIKITSKGHTPTGFVKLGSTNLLVHKCTKEIWKFNETGDEIIRLVEDNSEPLKI